MRTSWNSAFSSCFPRSMAVGSESMLSTFRQPCLRNQFAKSLVPNPIWRIGEHGSSLAKASSVLRMPMNSSEVANHSKLVSVAKRLC